MGDTASGVLVVSTDPAHSLGDALAARLGPEPRRIATRAGVLWALELAAGAALERWLAPRRAMVVDVALRGTYLDRQDVESLLALTPPGVDELVALAEVVRRAGELGCGEVVIDTAPTAHTLRLLAMPETLRRFAALLDALEDKHRLLGSRFGGGHQPDEADRAIAGIDREGAELAALLRDPARAGFWWVTLAEPLALAETRDGLAALAAAGIAVREVIVNRVVLPGGSEAAELHRRAQLEALAEAGEVLAGRSIRMISEQPHEPRGLAALRRLVAAAAPGRGRSAQDLAALAGSCLGGQEGGDRAASAQDSAGRAAADVATHPAGRVTLSSLPRHSAATPAGSGGEADRGACPASHPRSSELPGSIRDLLAPEGLRLLLFGGKGGVGKTTCAAAAALDLAASGRRVLLLSTDPAHSVGDVLGVELGDEERPVPGVPGLVARELDAEQSFERWRARSGDGMDQALAALTGRVGLGAVLEESAGSETQPGSGFVPPGLDEVVALVSLIDAVLPPEAPDPARDPAAVEAGTDFDLIVVDTAPTGHTLRLLALPEVALAWDHALLSLLLKYREVRPPGPLAADLVELSRGLKRFSALLRDPARARFVPVARAAELPVRETGRLLAALDRLGLAVPAVVVNAAEGGKGERRWIERLRGRCARGACAMILAPAVVPPPRGLAGLAGWSAGWRLADVAP